MFKAYKLLIITIMYCIPRVTFEGFKTESANAYFHKQIKCMLPQELPRALSALSPPLIQPKRENVAMLTTACMKVESSSQAVTAGRRQTEGRLPQVVLKDHQLGDAASVIDTCTVQAMA